MSVLLAGAAQIWVGMPRLPKSQFRAGNIGKPFRFVSFEGLGAKCRNAAIMPGTGGWMQGHRTGRAILFGLLLCSAFAVREGSAQPSAETIARGMALTAAGDCASCDPLDPAKPFAGGKRIDTPFGGIYSPNLTPDRDTGIGGGGGDDFFFAPRFCVAPTRSRAYPPLPHPNFTKITRPAILSIPAHLATPTPR